MKFPVIRESYFLNIVILIVSLFVSWFTLLFGLAHLIGTNSDNVNLLGVIFCIFLCMVGVIFLVVAIASIKGILYKLKRKTDH